MYQDDPDRSACDAPFNIAGIKAKRFIDISQNRNGAMVYHRCQNRDPQIGRDNHFLAWADTERGKGGVQRSGAAADGDSMLYPQMLSEFLFKLLHFFLEVHAIVAKQRTALENSSRSLNFLIAHMMNTRKFERKRLASDRSTSVNCQYLIASFSLGLDHFSLFHAVILTPGNYFKMYKSV